MRQKIETAYVVDKNELPEVFGEAVQMWALATYDNPSTILLCVLDHDDSTAALSVITPFGYEPRECFWRIVEITVEASSELAADNIGGDPTQAWHMKDRSWILEKAAE